MTAPNLRPTARELSIAEIVASDPADRAAVADVLAGYREALRHTQVYLDFSVHGHMLSPDARQAAHEIVREALFALRAIVDRDLPPLAAPVTEPAAAGEPG